MAENMKILNNKIEVLITTNNKLEQEKLNLQ